MAETKKEKKVISLLARQNLTIGATGAAIGVASGLVLGFTPILASEDKTKTIIVTEAAVGATTAAAIAANTIQYKSFEKEMIGAISSNIADAIVD